MWFTDGEGKHNFVLPKKKPRGHVMGIESCSTTVPLALELFPLGILGTFVLSWEADDLFLPVLSSNY